MCSHITHSLNFVLVKIMTTASTTTSKKSKVAQKAEAEALAKQQAAADASQATGDAEKPAETTADAPESTVVDQAEVVALGPLQLRVTNFGQKTVCQVTNRTIPKDGTVVIDYANPRQKQLAMGNFAQINKFNRDRKRFKVEG